MHLISDALTRVLCRLTWRDRAARFSTFARAELSSRYDLLAAANLSQNPSLAADFLRHASDEQRHARLFHHRARELGATGPLRADYEHLYETLGEADFLVFVHRGEARAIRQFNVWRAWLGPCRDSAAIDAVLPDEQRHSDYTGAASTTLPKGPVLRWEAKRTWMRAGGRLSGTVYTVLVTLLYLSLAPLAWAVRR